MQNKPVEISATPRTETGKGPARRLRATGQIPAVVYSAGKQSASLSVEPRELRKAVGGALGINQVLSLKLSTGSRTVLLKELQTDPAKHTTVHADFLEVDVTKPVKVQIPVVLVGKNKNIGEGGVIEQVNRRITVMALVTAIPEKIEVDISALNKGDSIHLSDVSMPAGLTVIGDGKETIATVVALREEKSAVVAVDAAAAAAPAAAAGAKAAPGAAAAAPAAAAGAKAAAPAKK